MKYKCLVKNAFGIHDPDRSIKPFRQQVKRMTDDGTVDVDSSVVAIFELAEEWILGSDKLTHARRVIAPTTGTDFERGWIDQAACGLFELAAVDPVCFPEGPGLNGFPEDIGKGFVESAGLIAVKQLC